jgi:adenylate cyclase
VEKTYTQARELCQQLDDTAQLVPVLGRLVLVYQSRAELQTARELAEQMLHLAQSIQDPYFLSLAHARLGFTLHMLGELTSARTHLEQGIALYDPHMHPRLSLGLTNPRLDCLFFVSMTLWHLGYPEQALQRSHEAVALVEGIAYPFSLAGTLAWAAILHLLRRDEKLARQRAEAVITLATEQEFPLWMTFARLVPGWVLVEQGQVQEGLAQMCQSPRSTLVPYVLAEAYGKAGQIEEGLSVTDEALAFVNKNGVRINEAELYRVKGMLTLQSTVHGLKSKAEGEAEACFLKAIETAQRQHAKSLELRAVMSLVRLRQQRVTQHASRNTQHVAYARLAEAQKLLSAVYTWFTEGFDTKDLQEAQTLIEELA